MQIVDFFKRVLIDCKGILFHISVVTPAPKLFYYILIINYLGRQSGCLILKLKKTIEIMERREFCTTFAVPKSGLTKQV